MATVADKLRKFFAEYVSFEDQITRVEREYRDFFGEKNCPPAVRSNDNEPGSEAWVKWEFLNRLLWIRGAIDRNDSALVFELAFELGALLERFDVISAYKLDIIRGGKQDQALRGARERGNVKRASGAAEQHTKWQQLADDLWREESHLSRSAVARIIRTRHNLSAAINTIRQHIKKPDEAR